MIQPLINTVCLASLIGIVSGDVGLAEDWPRWRGPRNDGTSIAKDVPIRWSTSENLRWRSPLPGQGGATPIVWGDRMFVTSADGDHLVLICLNTEDGKPLWKRVVTSGNQDARAGEGNSASPTPSTDGRHVWVFFSTGVLACYDFAGQEVWKLDANQRFGKLDIQFGMTSTPVLDGDHLYLQLIHGPMQRGNDQRTGLVIKLDKMTGQTIWRVERSTDADFECKHSYASPFMYDADGGKFLVVHGADCTTGHDLTSGKELWRLEGLNGPSAVNSRDHDPTFRFVASPYVGAGHVIVPTAKAGPTVALRVSESLSGRVSGVGPAVSWHLPTTPDVAIPLVVDGIVYLLHNDGRLQCVDLASGEQHYFERTHTSQHRASPFYASGHVYLCARDGVCTVVKAGTRFQVVASNDLGEPITASPIVAHGTLYLRTYDAVYAIAAEE